VHVNLKSTNSLALVKIMNKLSLIMMMTDALIKAGRPHTSCARACYVGRLYFSAFVVASVFVVAS